MSGIETVSLVKPYATARHLTDGQRRRSRAVQRGGFLPEESSAELVRCCRVRANYRALCAQRAYLRRVSEWTRRRDAALLGGGA